MKSPRRIDAWKAALIVSVFMNAVFLFLWLNAATAQDSDGAGGATERIVVVTATGVVQVADTEPTATAMPPASPTQAPTSASPTATFTAVPPTATSTPVPTETPEPTDTPAPTATVEATQVPTPAWLGYVNLLRAEGALQPLVENAGWSLGSEAHSRYTVKTDSITHSEDNASPWYSPEGHDAARNGNLAATVWYEAPPQWAIDYWITAPFHALPMLDPQLQAIGFGWYREQDGGTVFAANMDILRGLNQDLVDIDYPIMFPRDGGRAWVRQSVLFEYPDPLTACPGFVRPTGPPIILQVGTGNGVPALGGSSFRSGEQVLDHCAFSETTYVNPDPAAQRSGRRILDVRDAIVLIPRVPLQPDRSYTASIVVNGQQYSWTFTAVAGP